jgi:hypothetical protein
MGKQQQMQNKKAKSTKNEPENQDREADNEKQESSFWGKIGNFVKESVDCCLE